MRRTQAMELTTEMTSPLSRSLAMLLETKSLKSSEVLIVTDNAIRPAAELVITIAHATTLCDDSCRCLLGESFETIRSSESLLCFIDRDAGNDAGNDEKEKTVSPIHESCRSNGGNSRWDATLDSLTARRRPSPDSPVQPVRSPPSPTQEHTSNQQHSQRGSVSSQDCLPDWSLRLPMEAPMPRKLPHRIEEGLRISTSAASEQQSLILSRLNVVVPASA